MICAQDLGVRRFSGLPGSVTIIIPGVRDSPYKTLKEFIEAAKKEPGKLTVGGSSFFSGPHFAVMVLDKLTDQYRTLFKEIEAAKK